MPTIEFMGNLISCNEGDNLRDALIMNNLAPYNGLARRLNCFGLGTCGTCAVKITGPVSRMTRIEKTRLSLPPFCAEPKLRLSCQVKVLGNLKVEKGEGFWGQILIPG